MRKTYIVLDNSEDKLFIGGTLKLSNAGRHFLNIGAKASTKDGFANFVNSTKPNSDIGISAKWVVRISNPLYHNIKDTDQRNKIVATFVSVSNIFPVYVLIF